MNRFALLRHKQPAVGGGGGGTAAPTQYPQVSGVPREGQDSWVDAGIWPNTVNLYRFRVYHDASLVSSFDQADPGYPVHWPSGQSGYKPSVTVSGSTDSGATWGAEYTATNIFTYDSDYITPATIPAISGARTSSSGTTPMTFTVTGELYPCYLWHFTKKDASNTVTYEGTKPVTESELNTLTMDPLDGSVGPPPDPVMSSVGATEILTVALATPDYTPAPIGGQGDGAISNLIGFTPTDAVSGGRYGRVRFYGDSVPTAIKLLDGSSVDWAVGCPFTVDGVTLTPTGTAFDPYRAFDGDDITQGGFVVTSGSFVDVIVDMLVRRNIVALGIHTHSTTAYSMASRMSLALSDNPASFPTPILDHSGLTWGINDYQVLT